MNAANAANAALNKYLKKSERNQKTVYLSKIAKHLITTQSQEGGRPLKNNDIESVLDYLSEKYNGSPSETKKTYLVILYGPPASGKGLARKVANYYINSMFGEDNKNISESFIDTQVDQIVYDSIHTGDKTIFDVLTNNLQDKLKDVKMDKMEYIKQNIQDIASKSWDIYQTKRDAANRMSELLMHFAILFNKNIYIEIASPGYDYLMKIIGTMRYYKYIPIIIYPFCNDVNVLYSRSLERGIKEGRFLMCGKPFGIQQKAEDIIKEYPLYSKNLSGEHLILQYNACLSDAEFKEINIDISNIKKHIMHKSYSYKNASGDEITETYKVFDYDKKITIIGCK
jgi:hypothetical protein